MNILIPLVCSTTALWRPHSCMLGKSSSKCSQRRGLCSGICGLSPFTNSEEHLGFRCRDSSLLFSVPHRPQQAEQGAARGKSMAVVVWECLPPGKAPWVLWHFAWPVYWFSCLSETLGKGFSLTDADSSKHVFDRLTEGEIVPQQNQWGQCCLAVWCSVCCTILMWSAASAALWAQDMYSGSDRP